MANNFGGGSFTLLDYNREKSTVNFNVAAITGTSLPGTLTEFGALRTAIEGISLGAVSDEALYVNRTKITNIPPANPTAQRERKWLVQYEDVTEFFDPGVNAIPNAGYKKLFNVEIACANLEADGSGDRLLPNSDEADMTHPTIDGFVTAFEQLARSPYGGQINVVRITAVGRNS